jgi:hypothetical protein
MSATLRFRGSVFTIRLSRDPSCGGRIRTRNANNPVIAPISKHAATGGQK